ncbi:transglutaminase-like putative cysteine protease [Saccharopolyspora lacisalsi]|uniref:Transglutaminase-like putative cysteine protease n=1 Tax=Halosaccharopolyspora lacisalsi TaxID=1000566 RepID=A0A839DT03_9PSEU|nr:DUF3488 and transglutaminase-like domain-containing protein [Halosaccharopolyspora lacisalsi]MBA8823406.1 transglutaminase-like putative cysteine protease [Halosaccharopolyspora lacisalsi]
MSTRTGWTTLAAVFAVLLTSSSFTGVFADARWFPPLALVAGAVAGTGLLGRWLLTRSEVRWAVLVMLAQLAVTLVLSVLVFAGSFAELLDLLARAMDVVRNGVPPVPADTAVQSLVFVGIGLVTLLVDAIAVAARAPAVAGLVLLCVFAVPASLSDSILPWWAFVAGAAGFVLLLVVEGQQRRAPTSDGGHNQITVPRFGRHSLVVAGAASLVALLVGSIFTGVGTEGRLPGADPAGRDSATGGIGLRPFTSLRGQLSRDSPTELFRVRGLPRDAYLRAMTLREFDPNSGWKIAGLTRGTSAGKPLPRPPGTPPPQGPPTRIEIDPVGYRDAWLPVFGKPLRVSRPGDGRMGPSWRYDPAAGIIYTRTKQPSRPYVELAAFPDPSPTQLRRARGPLGVEPAYLELNGVPPRVVDLARRVTAGARTDFDRAVALNRFFTDPSNGFTYDLSTAPRTSSSALVDFLFHGKRGYCEQFASSMAVMLRAVGIPSRVAVGFTSGRQEGDHRVITTRDAHAWVEVHFPGVGWTRFDPTPLDDDRSSLPSYLNSQLPDPSAETSEPTPSSTETSEPRGEEHDQEPITPVRNPATPAYGDIRTVLAMLVAALGLLMAPVSVRSLRRRRRRNLVTGSAAGAASAAWDEVLDEFRDRGTRPAATETVRETAAHLSERYGLDADGTRAIRELVTAVERDWYAPAGRETDPNLETLLRQVVDGLHRSAPLSRRARLLPRSVLRFDDRG